MFGSTWGTQNTQPQQASAFGQPSAFGAAAPATNAFGSTSAFGQTQPQQGQQPQVNPMFGNITTPSSNTNTGAFGAFGGGNTANTGGAFGVKPATGFGAFGGGTSAFGSGATTGAFGQPANNATPASTSVFGQPSTNTTTSAFGGGTTSLFGGSKFGSTTNTNPTAPTVTTGTLNPPYNTVSEKDGTVTLQFQSISVMPAYVGYSFEELRVQDYAQNRKTATATGAFGQTAFGATQPSTSTLFGGQPQQPGQSLFGASNNTATPSAFGAFGQPAQPAATNPAPAFGGTGAFGQPQPQAQTSAFGTTTGAFGQPAQPQQQTSIFGTGGTSAFGNTANKPAFGTFGSGTGTGVFGGTGTSAFSSAQQPAQQPAQTTSIFGAAQPAATTQPSPFGAFGNTANAPKPSIFGTPATTTTTQPTTSAFGAFGSTPQQPTQPQQNTTPSIFGSGGSSLFSQPQQNQQQPAQTTSIFGGGQTTTPSLFGGNTNTGSSLFGGNQQAQQPQQQQGQQQQTNSLFGNMFNKPAQPTTSLFGGGQTQANTQPQTNSLFGSFGQSNQTNSLFGPKPAAPGLGGSLSGNQAVSTNLFGATSNNSGAQGSLTASINQPIGENLPIFSMLPPGPRLVDLEQNKRQAGFFVDLPTRSPVPRVQLGYSPASSKLRGYGSSPSLTSSTSGNSLLFASGKPGVLNLNKADSMSSSIGPDFLGRSGSPALGSGGRHSVKKVILDKKTEPIEVFVKTGSPGGLRTGKVTFSPALSIAAREKDAATATGPQVQDSPTPAPRPQAHKSPNRFTAPSTKEPTASSDADDQSSSTELGEGDYWVKPDLATLKKAGYDQLCAFEGLVVGRKGYGEIHFLKPVDLTGLPKLGSLLGEVVRFEDKECSVYPESDEAEKPLPGSGLNVESRISLERCWVTDKATREPLTDPNHAAVIKHLKRLKNMKGTHFTEFDMKTGTWTFTVDHF
ncbi:Nucleoporin nup189 [Psilocybe cubensis]|uniref:Nucleoporin nup189 n=2 Tax=Psilocybe cubensis TaxID=181762 RepID=A0ACB8H3W4_PSICU|nr:Nucleoporin nup189 [Psilocybe cubensis]KAH9482342.1 Nucleoporin nup189 [Psilocybe cubensis]